MAVIFSFIILSKPAPSASGQACDPDKYMTLIPLNAQGNPKTYTGNGLSISGDGRYVAFTRSQLLPGDTEGREYPFVYERLTCTTAQLPIYQGTPPYDQI